MKAGRAISVTRSSRASDCSYHPGLSNIHTYCIRGSPQPLSSSRPVGYCGYPGECRGSATCPATCNVGRNAVGTGDGGRPMTRRLWSHPHEAFDLPTAFPVQVQPSARLLKRGPQGERASRGARTKEDGQRARIAAGVETVPGSTDPPGSTRTASWNEDAWHCALVPGTWPHVRQCSPSRTVPRSRTLSALPCKQASKSRESRARNTPAGQQGVSDRIKSISFTSIC
ncbi:hypothetical protein GGR56DRAFT_144167 [Xylariaceae sp. FL0804]|nr:hypothetical protein GGR56DRAFT_144167 [Xylariaceae sp. FL0804]